jgi:hypothetical protein
VIVLDEQNPHRRPLSRQSLPRQADANLNEDLNGFQVAVRSTG